MRLPSAVSPCLEVEVRADLDIQINHRAMPLLRQTETPDAEAFLAVLRDRDDGAVAERSSSPPSPRLGEQPVVRWLPPPVQCTIALALFPKPPCLRWSSLRATPIPDM